jgi:hypothetical protein
MEWVKEHFSFLENCCFVETIDGRNGKIGDYYDLFLMSKAKHAIVPNSSFSWWGAYLNRNPAKIVVIPDKWLEPNVPIDLICPPEWKRITV